MQEMVHTAILDAYSDAIRIVDVESYRPGYLPYPARITLGTTTGNKQCVLKASKHHDLIAHEAHVLRAYRAEFSRTDRVCWTVRD